MKSLLMPVMAAALLAVPFASTATAQDAAAAPAAATEETCASMAAKYDVAKVERARSPNFASAKDAAARGKKSCADGKTFAGIKNYKMALRLLGA